LNEYLIIVRRAVEHMVSANDLTY